MIFLMILIIICVLLLLVVMISTVMKLVLLITTRYKYETTLLLFPSLLTLLSWGGIITAYIITITKLIGMNIFDILLYLVIMPTRISSHVIPILLISVGFAIFGILLQSLLSLTINIDYTKLKGNIRLLFKKSPKNKLINGNTEDLNTGIAIDDRAPKLTFGGSFIASLFTFSLTFFSIIVLVTIGFVISNKLV